MKSYGGRKIGVLPDFFIAVSDKSESSFGAQTARGRVGGFL